MATVTQTSIETTSKNSAISTEDDLYSPKTIVPLLICCAGLLINYIFTFTAMLIKGGKDFQTSYYILSKALAWSDFGVLITTAWYMAARLYKNPASRDHTLRYAWVFNGACAYFPGLVINWFLTWNRFTAIVFFSRYKIWFTIRRARFMVIFACVFALTDAFWINSLPYWLQHYFYMLMPGVTIFMFLLAYPVCIVVSILRIKSNMAAHDKKKFVVEIKLLIQAILVGCSLFSQEFLYQITAGGLIYEIFFMLYGGLNPFIYLCLDAKIRRAYLRLLHLKSAENIVTPTSKTGPQVSVIMARDRRK